MPTLITRRRAAIAASAIAALGAAAAMMHRSTALQLCCAAAPEASAPTDAKEDATAADRNWPQWRGPLSTGVAPHADPPIEWSETKNIRWKVELPGKGHSSPIVWGDRIYVTAAVPFGDALPPRYGDAPGAHDNLPTTHHMRFVVIAVNRKDGAIVWQTAVREALPHEGGHVTGSLASNSAVTDGQRVYASFGSYGVYCIDRDGKVLWKRDFGLMQVKHGHGEGSSPALYAETLIVNWDHEAGSFIIALDKRTGETRWKVARDELTSWATPIVVEVEGKAQVIVSGTTRVRAYDLNSGDVIWECGGLSSNVVASPVAGHGMVFAGSSYDKQAFLAIHLAGAKGDLTGGDHVVWSRSRGTPYVPSPLLYGDALYFHVHYQNVMVRLDAATGDDAPGAFRLPGIRNVYASAVGAAGRVYITDRDGTTLVLSHAAEPQGLALNKLDDTFSASAALVDRELFLRGEKHLYCIARE